MIKIIVIFIIMKTLLIYLFDYFILFYIFDRFIPESDIPEFGSEIITPVVPLLAVYCSHLLTGVLSP